MFSHASTVLLVYNGSVLIFYEVEKPASLPDEDELAEEEVRKHYLHKMCY